MKSLIATFFVVTLAVNFASALFNCKGCEIYTNVTRQEGSNNCPMKLRQKNSNSIDEKCYVRSRVCVEVTEEVQIESVKISCKNGNNGKFEKTYTNCDDFNANKAKFEEFLAVFGFPSDICPGLPKKNCENEVKEKEKQIKDQMVIQYMKGDKEGVCDIILTFKNDKVCHFRAAGRLKCPNF